MQKTKQKNNTAVWISANVFGHELLKEARAIKGVRISAIFTLSKKSKTKMYDGIPTKEWKKFGIPVYEVENINNEYKKLVSLNPSLIILCGWRQIVDEKILNLPKYGTIGFHPTLLPKGRGPAPIINSIMSHVKNSGVTMFYLDEGVDTGDIVGQEKFKIEENNNAEDIYKRIVLGGKKLVRKYLMRTINGNAPRRKQNNKIATRFKPRSLSDNEIKPSDSLETAYDKIRALGRPYNGAYIKKGNKKLIIWNAELLHEKEK